MQKPGHWPTAGPVQPTRGERMVSEGCLKKVCVYCSVSERLLSSASVSKTDHVKSRLKLTVFCKMVLELNQSQFTKQHSSLENNGILESGARRVSSNCQLMSCCFKKNI